jgi:hypothetical protein
MHTLPSSAAAAPLRRGDHYVVRLSPALAAMCGQENCYEDEVLGKLRAVALALSTAAEAAAAAGVAGRGFQSSTYRLNLSRSCQ